MASGKNPAEVEPDMNPAEYYEQNLTRYKDERDEIQKKTFTKWVNKHLVKHWKHDEARKQIRDLYEDLRDGHSLVSLLEVLSQEIIPRERGRLRFHRLQNVQNALDFLRYKKIKLVNIRNDDIVDGNAKLTLGLIWTIILHFQISDIIVAGQPDDKNVKEALLLWSRRTTDGYPGVNIKDFGESWRDGLAFNAILHRNRPELIDFKSLSRDNRKANLENAFSVAEDHFGVTRLLDPEDVDRPHPDDKSIMTYVSSMYDVFPEVPDIQSSLADNERALRWEEYQDCAGRLMQWVSHSTALMEDRNFPNNLQDVRQLLQHFNQYRIETVPPKINEKHKVAAMFRELEKLFAPTGQFHVPQGLHIQDIEEAWDRLMIAQQERDKMLRSEINRLENLYLLAEKVLRQIRNTTDTLDGLERRIETDEPRIEKMHPADAKKRVDQIDAGLKMCETTIREMFNDTQMLKDGQYYQADQIYRRVFNLHERWLALRNRLQTNITSKVASMTLTTEETTVTRRFETRTEYRVVETNEIFKFIQECLIWIQNKQAAIDSLDYGNDLPSVQRYLRQHSEEHRVITEFRTNIDRCRDAKSNLAGDEYTLYVQHLTRLEQVYSSLLDSSAKRIKDLELLLEFMQAATTELMWLNEKEENEVSRDWSAKNLNIPELEEYFQNLLSELQNREGQFNGIQSKGQQLAMHGHPASQTIEAYLQAMTSQWDWLLQLTICLEQHLKHAAAYHQFYGDAHECEQWLNDQAELLNRKFDRSDLSLEESTDLLQELFEMKEKLMEYKDGVGNLVARSKQIVPLKQRRQYLKTKLPVTALCDYKLMEISIERGEECVLVDNTHKTKWKIITSVGQEATVPGVCFLLPPPNREAIEYIARLEIQYQHLLTLWRSKHMKLKQIVTRNQIVLNINKVKHMSLQQFEDMDPTQREAIIRQLNDDTQRLMTESRELGQVTIDPVLQELEKEVDNCNQLIEEMSRGAEGIIDPQEAQNILTEMDNFMGGLDIKVSSLQTRLKSPIPRDSPTVDRLLQEQQTFHKELTNQEPQYHSLKISCESIVRQAEPLQKPQYQSHLTMFVEKWNYVWNISLVHTQTLTISSVLLKSLQTAKDIVSRYEKELVSHENLPSDLAQLQSHQEALEDMQRSLPPCQPIFNQLKEEVTKLRSFQQPTANERDVERFEKEVHNITTRWQNVCTQTNERSRKSDVAFDVLREFKDSLLDERNWLAQAQATMMLLDTTVTDRRDLEKQIDEVKVFLDEINDHRPSVEEFNSKGNQYIQVAQTYDCLLEDYRDSLQDVADTGESKRPKIQSGVDNAIQEIEAVNDEYSKLGAEVAIMLRSIAQRLNIPEGDILERFTQFHPVSGHAPRVRTEVLLHGVRADVDTAVQTKRVTTTTHKHVIRRTVLHPITGEPMLVDEPCDDQPEEEMTPITFTSIQSRVNALEQGAQVDELQSPQEITYPDTMQEITPSPSSDVDPPRKRALDTRPKQKPDIRKMDITTSSVKTPPSSPPKSPEKKKHVPSAPRTRIVEGPIELSLSVSKRESPEPNLFEGSERIIPTKQTFVEQGVIPGNRVTIEIQPGEDQRVVLGGELDVKPVLPGDGREPDRPEERVIEISSVERHYKPAGFKGPTEITLTMPSGEEPSHVQVVETTEDGRTRETFHTSRTVVERGEASQSTGVFQPHIPGYVEEKHVPLEKPVDDDVQEKPIDLHRESYVFSRPSTDEPSDQRPEEPSTITLSRDETYDQWTEETPDGLTTTRTTQKVIQISSSATVISSEDIPKEPSYRPDEVDHIPKSAEVSVDRMDLDQVDGDVPQEKTTAEAPRKVTKVPPKVATKPKGKRDESPGKPKSPSKIRTESPEKKKPESPKKKKSDSLEKKKPESPKSRVSQVSIKPESPSKGKKTESPERKPLTSTKQKTIPESPKSKRTPSPEKKPPTSPSKTRKTPDSSTKKKEPVTKKQPPKPAPKPKKKKVPTATLR